MGKTLEEIREAKAEAEQAVWRVLHMFEAECNVSIRDVRVEILRTFGSKPALGIVQLDVEI